MNADTHPQAESLSSPAPRTDAATHSGGIRSSGPAPTPAPVNPPGASAHPATAKPAADSPSESEPVSSPGAAELHESVARIESLIREIRTTFESHVRDERHRDFSYLLLVGVVLQVAAGGMLLLAGLDWLFAADQVGLFIKAIFAIVLQGMAMTALLMSRGGK